MHNQLNRSLWNGPQRAHARMMRQLAHLRGHTQPSDLSLLRHRKETPIPPRV